MGYYQRIFKKPWPYWVGAVILALLNILLLITGNSPWRITGGFVLWGSGILRVFGLDPSSWHYFSMKASYSESGVTYINNDLTVLNIAIILGALMAVLWASEFKVKKIKNKKQFFFALGGGIIMGYGTRLSFGCNIGAYFSAIPSFSLHGWIFGIFAFAGAWIGSKILFKYIL
jgi:uncharacterized protein